MDEKGKEIAVAKPKGIVFVDTQLSAREPMNLTTARAILETVVNTHENTFTETSDLARVGSYDIEQVRDALISVSQDIMRNHGTTKFGRKYAEKQTQYGKLLLTVRQQLYRTKFFKRRENISWSEEPLSDDGDDSDWARLENQGVKAGEPATLGMLLLAKDWNSFLLRGELPLRGNLSAGTATGVGFYDYRDGGSMVSMYDFTYDTSRGTIDGYKYMWRGLRWISKNMLNWDGGFQLPEDLDRSLPELKNNPPLLK